METVEGLNTVLSWILIWNLICAILIMKCQMEWPRGAYYLFQPTLIRIGNDAIELSLEKKLKGLLETSAL